MIYAWRYPQRVHRSVMLGANPPGNFLWDAKTTGEQIERCAALCAEDASCHGRTRISRRRSLGVRRCPDSWWFLPIRKGNVQLGAFFGLGMRPPTERGPSAGHGRSTRCSRPTRATAAGHGLLS